MTRITELQLIARTHSRAAIATLAGIIRSRTASDSARIAAVNSLLDRGWGKATASIVTDGGKPTQARTIEIVNTIVDPKEASDEASPVEWDAGEQS